MLAGGHPVKTAGGVGSRGTGGVATAGGIPTVACVATAGGIPTVGCGGRLIAGVGVVKTGWLILTFCWYCCHAKNFLYISHSMCSELIV